MNRFTMMVGISGSGKSYEAAQRANETGARVISSDTLREELLGDINDQTQNQKVFNEMFKRTVAALVAGEDVIYDATNMRCTKRMSLLTRLREAVGADFEKHVIVMLTPLEECVKRQYERERQVSEEVIYHQLSQFQCPYYYEGWDSVTGIYPPVDRTPLIWYLEQNRIPHDNPHHSLDVCDHMTKTGQILLDKFSPGAPYKPVLEAAKFHDIGKFFTKRLKPDGTATYYGHQNVGAYFYLTAAKPVLAFTGKEVFYTAVLIQWHMEFLTRRNKDLKALRRMVGNKIYRHLQLLNECDVAAH